MATQDPPPVRALMLPPGVQPNLAVFSSPLPKPLTWQRREHAIQRRTILAHIATLLAQTQRNQMPTQNPSSWALPRKLEVLLYLNSASLLEYSNLHSLQRRVQALTATIINRQIRKETQQPPASSPGLSTMASSSCQQSTPAIAVSPPHVPSMTRVEFGSGVHHHVSDCMVPHHYGLLRTPLDTSAASVVGPPFGHSHQHPSNHKRARDEYQGDLENKRPCQRRGTSKPSELAFLMLRGYDELSKMIWSFVDGQEIFRCRAVNRQARELLPLFVTSLHLSCNAFQRALATHSRDNELSVLCKCVNLAQIEVVSLSAGVAFGRKSMRAANCPQRFVVTHRDHEEIVLALADHLQPTRFPKLVHLGLTCLFTNEEANGEADVLLNTLMRGCCPRLEELCLPGNSIGDYGASKVAELLRSNACPGLKRLDLRKNFIGETGTQLVCRAIADGCVPELTELCLGGNMISESGFQYVLEAIESGYLSKLKYLGLEMNYLSGACMQRLGTSVGKLFCPLLTQISYSENSVPDQEAKRIIAVAIYQERARNMRRQADGPSEEEQKEQEKPQEAEEEVEEEDDDDDDESEYYSDVTYYSQDEADVEAGKRALASNRVMA